MTKRHPGRPPKESWPTCKADQCVEEARAAKGFCQTHYMAARRGRLDWETGEELRPLMRVPSYGEGARCRAEGCLRRPRADGMCPMHYQRVRQHPELPATETLVRGQKPLYTDTARCIVVGCDQRPVNRWMCSKHAQQRMAGIIDEQGNQLRALQTRGRRRQRDRWIGGTRDGYILRVAPEGHPHARVNGTILEHRLVMEQVLGRFLEDWEIVHHKDGNRQHNDWENLELLDGRAAGSERHHPGHEFDAATVLQLALQQEGLSIEARLSLRKRLQELKGSSS